jgi:hypothetical protein
MIKIKNLPEFGQRQEKSTARRIQSETKPREDRFSVSSGFRSEGPISAAVGLLARIPLEWNHPRDKNTRGFNELEHVLIGKVDPLFRNML